LSSHPVQLSTDSAQRCFNLALIQLSACKKKISFFGNETFSGLNLLISGYGWKLSLGLAC
jgi:hypothetical protein